MSEWRAGLILANAQGSWPYLIEWEGWRHESVVDGEHEGMGNAQPGTMLFTVPLTVGSLMNVRLYGSVNARSSVSAGGYADSYVVVLDAIGHADLGNTIAWGGIVSLTDAQGRAVSGFSALSSGSGFDYAAAYVAAVPEPAALLQMLAGLLLLIGVGHCRLQRQPARLLSRR